MGEIEEEKFDQLCRLCASYDAVQMDIFGEKGRERKIIEKIHTCLPFQVQERDLLPKSICYRCMYNLENFYDFRKGCVDAVNRLERFIASSGRLKFKHDFERNEESISTAMVTDDDDDIPNPADFLEAACLVGESSNNQTECKETINNLPNTEYPCPADDFRCTTCGRTFNSRGALTLHSKYHTGESDQSQLFTCHVCEKVFSSKGHLASHSKVHIGDLTDRQPSDPSTLVHPRPFKCDLCEKAYSMAKHLWGHVSVSHKGDPSVTCQFCNRTFSTIANLEDHKKSKHASEISALIAETLQGDEIEIKTENQDFEDDDDGDPDEDYDDVEEENGEYNEEDESKHDNDETSNQEQPNKRKNSKPRRLKREGSGDDQSVDDKSNCTEQRTFSCLICQKIFEAKNLLHDHLLECHGIDPVDITLTQQHVGESNYEDEYVAPENMVEAEAVFGCEVCVRDFNDRASLWLHMLYSHRQEAATTCGLCLRVCPDFVSLTDHVHNCHPKDSLKSDQKRYSCQICGRQLDSKKKLLTHVKIHNLYDNSGQVVDPETVIVMNSKYNQQNLQSLLKESSEYENSIFENLKEDGHVMSCEICFKVFPNEEKLVKHKQNAHRNSQGPNSVNSSTTYYLYFSCEICGLSHSTRTERWRHVFSCHADEPSLLCEEKKCSKVFPTRALKNEHAATHHSLQGEVPNTCEVCGKLWATRINFWKHMMSVHSDCLPFICGVCLKIFCTVADLSTHVRELHSPLTEGDFCCDICGRPYSNKSKMSRHRKIHVLPESEGGLPPGHELEISTPVSEKQSSIDPADLLKCSLCPEEEFTALEQLTQHRRSVHNQVPCDLCTKFYGRSSHLWKHVNKIHKNHPDITCNVCFQTSASRRHLANHMAKHHRDESKNYVDISELSNEETIHTCDKCKKVFRKHMLMRKHMKHCVGPKDSGPIPSPCDRCTKVFDSPVLLRKHKRSSHLLFRCEVCEDVAHDSRIELMDHIKADHPGHPDLACTFDGCDKMLRCKADLDKHKREHRLGRMPPTCGFCGELTPNKMKLRNHLKTQHPALTKYLCAVCLVTYKDFDDLRKHVNSLHKAILTRPNVCPICARTYSNKSKVLAHIRSHGENFFPCNKCLKICTKEEQLKRHLDAHMEENSEDEIEENDEEEDESQTIETETINDDVESTDKNLPTGEEDENDSKDESKKAEEASVTNDVPDDVIDNDVDEIPSKRPRRSYTHACSACSTTFLSAGELLDHTKAEHNELLCACGKISDNIDSHNAHAKKCVSANKAENNKKLGIVNNKTDVTTKNILNIDRKRKSATNIQESESRYSMDIGESRMSLNDGLNKNIVRHREVRRVYKVDEGLCFCELCNKSFDAKRHLWQHLRRFHIKEAATSCGVCLKVCRDYPSLDAHLAAEHKNNFEGEGKNFTCRVCGRYHNSRSKLEQHSVIHPGQQARTQAALYNCAYCSLVFNSESVLLKHELSEHQQPNDTGKRKAVVVQDEDSRSSTSSSSSNNSSSSSSSENSTSSNNSSSSSTSGSSSSNSSSSSNNSSSSSSSSEDEDDNEGEKHLKKTVKSESHVDDGSSCEIIDDKSEERSGMRSQKKLNKSKNSQSELSNSMTPSSSSFTNVLENNRTRRNVLLSRIDNASKNINETNNKLKHNLENLEIDNNSIVSIDDDDDDDDYNNKSIKSITSNNETTSRRQKKINTNQNKNRILQMQPNKAKSNTNSSSSTSSSSNRGSMGYEKPVTNSVSNVNLKDSLINITDRSTTLASNNSHPFAIKSNTNVSCNLSEDSSASSDEGNSNDDNHEMVMTDDC